MSGGIVMVKRACQDCGDTFRVPATFLARRCIRCTERVAQAEQDRILAYPMDPAKLAEIKRDPFLDLDGRDLGDNPLRYSGKWSPK
ncbi:MAG: hypothetical protein NVSMB32_09170 [Actinomycetota bacterium]